MRKIFLIFFLFAGSIANVPFSFCQESTKVKEFHQIEDSITIANIINLGIQYSKTDILKAKILFKEAETISSKIGYKRGLADGYYNSGIIYKQIGRVDSSYYFFNSSLFFYRRLNDKSGIVKCLNALATYYQEAGNYGEAIRNCFRSLDILIETDQHVSLAEVYHNLGSLYLELDKNEKALNYCLSAYKLEQNQKDTNAIAKSLYNAGLAYLNLDSIKEAHSFFDQSLEINLNIGNKKDIAQSYLGIARVLDRIDKMDEAAQFYIKSINLFKESGKIKELAGAFYYYGCHAMEKKIDNANDTALQFLLTAEKLEARDKDSKLRKDIYSKMEIIYTSLGNFEKALEYSNLFKKAEKELETPETLQYLAVNEAEYNFKIKEEKARLEHEAKLQKQKEFKIIFLGSTLLFLLISSLILFGLLQKNKRNKLLKSANDTRDKMFRLIAHDFRSPLISISNTVHLIPYKIKNQNYNEVVDLCENVTNSVNRVLSLIDNLINWTLSQNKNIPYKPEIYNLIDLSNEIVEIYKPVAGYKNIELNNLISKEHLIYADKNILNTVLRNLINNAIKFTPDNGAISLTAKKNNGDIEIIIRDNGVGIAKDRLVNIFGIDKEKEDGTKGEVGNGLGLFFCKEFVNKNKGEIWVESEIGKGSIFYFTVPSVKVN